MATSILIDQLGNRISLQRPVKRIVSLVPSQTELLFELGLDEEVVGITRFCVHPMGWLESKTQVGGTKKFDFSIIKQLNPDLIIGNKEENYRDGIEQLQQKYPVWMSDIGTLEGALDMIKQMGLLVEREKRADKLVEQITKSFSTLPSFQAKRVLYLIWRKPWMAVGPGTFIHNMLHRLSFINVVQQNRYPELTDATIQLLNPDIILLSSEPYSFTDKHKPELQALCPQAVITLVDGEMFSWYGSRLQHAPTYFRQLYTTSL